jgi:hypothetical protein
MSREEGIDNINNQLPDPNAIQNQGLPDPNAIQNQGLPDPNDPANINPPPPANAGINPAGGDPPNGADPPNTGADPPAGGGGLPAGSTGIQTGAISAQNAPALGTQGAQGGRVTQTAQHAQGSQNAPPPPGAGIGFQSGQTAVNPGFVFGQVQTSQIGTQIIPPQNGYQQNTHYQIIRARLWELAPPTGTNRTGNCQVLSLHKL